MDILSDLDLAHACADAYRLPATYQAADCFALRFGPQDGKLRLAFRGSHSLLDWLTDLKAWTVSVSIGDIHEGFWRDGSALFAALLPLAPGPAVLAGHSKGAAEAAIVAALMIAAGWPTPQLVTFGCPRFVYGRGAILDLLGACPGAQYRNGLDPVPEAPPELSHPFEIRQLARVDRGLNIIDDHLLPAYCRALPGVAGTESAPPAGMPRRLAS